MSNAPVGSPGNIIYENRHVHRQGAFITGYTFTYRQWFEGFAALGFGGLRGSLGDGSLVHMSRSLYRLTGKVKQEQKVLTARQVLKILAPDTMLSTAYSPHFLVYGMRLGCFTP